MDLSFKKIIALFLNRSLFWKVGFIIGVCVLVNFAQTFYFYSVTQDLLAKAGIPSTNSFYFERSLYFLVILVLIFLIWGAVAFWFMVKKPLEKIINTLDILIYDPGCLQKDTLLEFTIKDEIGDLASKVNTLVKNFSTLETFRHLIENDETVEEVYTRLGEYLKSLSFSSFVIYEVSNSQNTMRPVYKSDEELEVNSEKLFNADRCRAKRTGKVVTSLEAPHVCKLYEYSDVTNHYCLPILSGNKVLGVVEIHLPATEVTLSSKKFREKLQMVHRYVDETAPVVESKRYAEALKEQTHKDPLTNLYNRRFLEGIIDNLVAQILRRGTSLGILMCDLDYFKSINDKYGHEVGDFVLKEISQILAGNVRKSDLVVRFGGEEFLVLLVDVREGEAEKVAEKLRKAIEMHEFKTPKGIIKRTISIGVSEFPQDTSAIWEAIKFADIALYKAKEAGRNKVVRFRKEFWTEEEY
jgi:diguanylate cyclase (GGDEF)-like protein